MKTFDIEITDTTTYTVTVEAPDAESATARLTGWLDDYRNQEQLFHDLSRYGNFRLEFGSPVENEVEVSAPDIEWEDVKEDA